MGRTVDVVIVGAGIPGLALALELQQRKLSTLLMDARKNVETVPRGLTLQPNGLEALEKLGVLDKARQTGSGTRIFEIRSYDTGELLLEADYGLLDHPHNYLLTVNATELDLLLRYKAERTGAEILGGAKFQELVRDRGQLRVVFETDEGKEEVKASVVVGADGPQSRVRASIGSRVQSRKYPDSFVVGLVGPASGLEDRAREYQGPGQMLGIMRAGPTSTYLFQCVGPVDFDELRRVGLEKFKAGIVEAAPEMRNALARVEAWTRLGYFTPYYTRVDPWVANGVALLGDSAHSFHPHAGQGLNLSLQDALALAEVVEKSVRTGDTSARTLREYQARRKMFADVIGQHADYSAKYALSRSWLYQTLNRRAMRKLSKNQKLLRQALEITAGVFEKKPSLIQLARIGGILP